MTQKEIDNFLTNTKVYVNGKSKEIQEKLFSFGFSWGNTGKNVFGKGKPFLFFNENKEITWGEDMNYFKEHKNREITAEEILSIELTGPTYRPFKDAEECWNCMHKHSDFGWVIRKETGNRAHINTIIPNGVMFVDEEELLYSYMIEHYTFTDSTPFGIKKE